MEFEYLKHDNPYDGEKGCLFTHALLNITTELF